jgi:hypothetical protein
MIDLMMRLLFAVTGLLVLVLVREKKNNIKSPPKIANTIGFILQSMNVPGKIG